MIDFDNFWAETGCLPGLTREETEDQLQQMAAHFAQLGSGTPDLSDIPGIYPGPGVTEEQLAAWDGEHGVRLPDVLRHALQRQDGGYLRDHRFRIYSLAEMAAPNEEFWEWACYKEEEIPDRRLVICFAENDEIGGRYFLNFNAQGPQQEPSVFVHHHDPGDLDRCAKSVTKFFARMLESSDTPLAQAGGTGSLETITQETYNLSFPNGWSLSLEQTLGRQAGALVLWTHETTPEGERYTRTTLPEPLDSQASHLGALGTYPPPPTPTFTLHLQPRDPSGIVHVESQRTSNGRWKNTTQRGGPLFVQFKTTDRGRLETLRRLLFGEEAATRAQNYQDKFEQLQQKWATLSPKEMQAAGMQMFLQMREQFGGQHSAQSPDPPELPPELAALSELVKAKMDDVMKRARDIVANQPVDPEVLRLLQEAMPPPPEAEEGE
jgi:hypothetical protein